ncbi:DUF721 domain-containing protein [Micromonospora humi]|uniref:Predicted nucleic acid-binding protein, contains Zn-ribbon domain (Includes truncated derivatives) n=1 Tax=Micromonospora humi TaxID=745366 RepID=A0A1C5IAY9_9ACTN|nr:Predicted nucleic acid-binding protein, contains Zn-ribbon domain (includes truncated derivatives) [Micromonospora humi]
MPDDDEVRLPPARLGPGRDGGTAAARGEPAPRTPGKPAGGERAAPRTPGKPAAGEPDVAPEGSAGPELARAVLDAAKAKRQAAAGSRRRSAVRGDGEKRLRGYSGPGPDPRDPQPLGAVLDRLVKARGWQQPAAEATVFGAWEKVVGPDVAQHSRPVKLENGELTVEARSTAWATQLRLLAGSLLKQIASEVGHNVVRKLHIHGPAAPSWSRGPRRVRGRGPRDTYG